MNTEVILSLQQQVEELSSTLSNVQKVVNALKINDQRRLNSNNPIPPGIACKVAYDNNGLVVKGVGLESTDIPELNIDKIINLKQSLDSKASIRDLEKFKSSISDMIKPAVDNLSKVTGTGTKVNYNSDGRIVSTADLLPEDIPTLPITKIEGLSDIIEFVNVPKNDSVYYKNDNDIKVSAGTYAKVNVDNTGRVLSGDRLTINDLPSEVISKINIIESKIPELASKYNIDIINNNINNKVTANESIDGGVFTKVKVDSKGLVTRGDKLTIRDLPEINISNITNLDKVLKNKADQNDLLTISDTVSSLVNSMNSIGEINGIKNELNMKASDQEVKKINSKVNSIQNTVNSLVNRMPSDMLEAQLSEIQNELSILSGRISVIEQHLSL